MKRKTAHSSFNYISVRPACRSRAHSLIKLFLTGFCSLSFFFFSSLLCPMICTTSTENYPCLPFFLSTHFFPANLKRWRKSSWFFFHNSSLCTLQWSIHLFVCWRQLDDDDEEEEEEEICAIDYLCIHEINHSHRMIWQFSVRRSVFFSFVAVVFSLCVLDIILTRSAKVNKCCVFVCDSRVFFFFGQRFMQIFFRCFCFLLPLLPFSPANFVSYTK